MTVREVFASFLRGADNGTNAIHANRAAVLAHASRALVLAAFLRGADNGTNAIHTSRAAVMAHASRALVLAGPKGRLP